MNIDDPLFMVRCNYLLDITYIRRSLQGRTLMPCLLQAVYSDGLTSRCALHLESQERKEKRAAIEQKGGEK